jgi:hypothetical protein
MRTKYASQGRLLPSDDSIIDIALVPAADASGPVVDVAIVPAGKRSRRELLQTLAELRAVPQSIPKPSTKLARAVANKAARLLDAKKLRDWAKAVKDRDQWKDRKTGRRVLSTRSLDPDRAEAHHIEPKATWATRYDVRNGICLSYAMHDAVERYVYRIEGTVFFRKDGATYIDARFPVVFVRL